MTLGRFNELDLMRALAQADGRSGTLIDVGAHIGSYSVAFAELGWSVIAIEPAPGIFDELRQALEQFDQAEAIQAAVTSEEVSEVDFYLSAEYWGIHSLRPFHETHTESVRVPALRLDALLTDRKLDDPVFLKVDTEGADLYVLKSLDVDRTRPAVIMCEFMDERTVPHFGYSYLDTLQYMEKWGYTPYISEWAPVIEPSRRAQGGGPFHHLGVMRTPLAHAPAWGNLIFVEPELTATFESILMDYLTKLQVHAEDALTQFPKLQKLVQNMRDTLDNRERKIENMEKALQQARARVQELESAVHSSDARIEAHLGKIQILGEQVKALQAAGQRGNED
ncbi:MAG: FkbM family methyltransferase [Acidimicrobiia bacterium]